MNLHELYSRPSYVMQDFCEWLIITCRNILNCLYIHLWMLRNTHQPNTNYNKILTNYKPRLNEEHNINIIYYFGIAIFRRITSISAKILWLWETTRGILWIWFQVKRTNKTTTDFIDIKILFVFLSFGKKSQRQTTTEHIRRWSFQRNGRGFHYVCITPMYMKNYSSIK